jgi:hypothetical protein
MRHRASLQFQIVFILLIYYVNPVLFPVVQEKWERLP